MLVKGYVMKMMQKLLLSLAITGLIATPAIAGSGMQKTEKMEQKAAQTVVDVAASNPDFKTLVAAIKAAGLAETLSGKGPFTVFAPTDAAFAKLPPGTLEDLLKPENKEKLVAILTYHVVSGKVSAADVVKIDKAATVNGKSAAITVADGAVKVDAANVIATDIAASNGVIHVIDTVLIPQ
jgi:uncharacterized surface protein with fasciclin (FAS1) repeats